MQQRRASKGGGDRTDRAAAQCLGRSRGWLSSTLHALVEAHRRPIALHLTPGSNPDGADALLPCCSTRCVIADCSYDAFERVIEPLRAAGRHVVIPATRSRKT